LAMPRLAIAQLRPTKGEYATNVQKIGGVLAQVARLERPPELVVFPETVTSGYFVEGGVREVAVTAGTLYRDLALARGAAARRGGRLLRGVPEPLLQLVPVRHAGRRGRGRAARAPQGVPPHLRRVRRGAVRGAGARGTGVRHELGARRDPHLRGRVALAHRDDRGARGGAGDFGA